jgi:hypothetical protein
MVGRSLLGMGSVPRQKRALEQRVEHVGERNTRGKRDGHPEQQHGGLRPGVAFGPDVEPKMQHQFVSQIKRVGDEPQRGETAGFPGMLQAPIEEGEGHQTKAELVEKP